MCEQIVCNMDSKYGMDDTYMANGKYGHVMSCVDFF